MATEKKSGKLQTDVLETLSSHIARIEQFAGSLAKKKLIISTELKVEPFEEDRGIKKTPIVWPMMDYKMFYTVEVPPNTTVATHSHDEAVFRVLVSGSLILNGKKIDQPGTWYVVPALTEYEIKTETGYVVISGYTSVCRTGREQASKKNKRSAPQG